MVVAGAASAVGASGALAATTVALWRMDERSGTSMLDSARGHTGTLAQGASRCSSLAGTASRPATSSVGRGASFPCPSAADLNPGSATITIGIHLKTTSAPASPDWDLIRKGLYTTSGGEWKMEYQPTGQASCGFKGSSGYAELQAGPSLKDGKFHLVQCVKTSSQIKVVVDGVAYAKSANVGSIANSTAIAVGARPGSEYFKGYLDEASIAVG